MTFKLRPGATPEKKADIISAARDVLEKSRSLFLFTPPYRVGMPQFFGLYRKTLHVTRTINPTGFQPFEKHADRTLAIAVAILVTDEKGPSKAEAKWLDWATERGVACHTVKTWGEFTHAIGELSDI
jgi:hypothetical protein